MNSETKDAIEFVQVKAVCLAVTDAERAKRFYKETLGLPPENVHQMNMAFMIGDVILLLKTEEEWYGKPSKELNARITLEVKDSYATEKALLKRCVTISDPVAVYGDNPIGAFLDSEGNKLWFCSEGKKEKVA
jgi:catechol 2,3-dioxygenase-like lactoylglutathione lyase family enzyme